MDVVDVHHRVVDNAKICVMLIVMAYAWAIVRQGVPDAKIHVQVHVVFNVVAVVVVLDVVGIVQEVVEVDVREAVRLDALDALIHVLVHVEDVQDVEVHVNRVPDVADVPDVAEIVQAGAKIVVAQRAVQHVIPLAQLNALVGLQEILFNGIGYRYLKFLKGVLVYEDFRY